MHLLWVITGASHNLGETLEYVSQAGHEVDIAFSLAGEKALQAEGLINDIAGLGTMITSESEGGAHPMLITTLSRYEAILIAPCTANTCAKIRCGIADSLASNIASQAIKRGVRTVILPTDYEKEIKTKWRGKDIALAGRDTDIENVRELKKTGEVEVVLSVAELAATL